MASNVKKLRDAIKSEWVAELTKYLEIKEYEVLQTASNEIAVPVVDSEGGEHYVVLTVKIPTGSRDGEEYDGYSMASEYATKCADREAKAKERARKDAERQAKKDK